MTRVAQRQTVQGVETALPEVLTLTHTLFGDERGFFYESFHSTQLASLIGTEYTFVQDNHSRSTAGVLRGIHYQLHSPQGKLVRVTRGRAYDVAVDLRRSSPTFGRWVGLILDDVKRLSLWIPPGFGHAFLALTPQTELQYKCTTYYDPGDERSITWCDPTLAIDWPLHLLDHASPLLSEKDRRASLLLDAECYR